MNLRLIDDYFERSVTCQLRTMLSTPAKCKGTKPQRKNNANSMWHVPLYPSNQRALSAAYSSRSSMGRTSSSLWIILSNSSRSIPDAFARRNKLLISVLMCCLIASSV
jgi:hypothetical protein